MQEINYLKEIDRIIKFIQDTFKEKGFTRAVIGVSGGLDSAVVTKLLKEALGEQHVFGYLLPYHLQKDASDAGSFARKLGIQWEVINIGDIVDTATQYMDMLDATEYPIRVGNLKARVRMMMLYDLSAQENALVVGTSNKTELMLGYFTIHGDGACALAPIGHLYKTQVKELAQYLKIPEKIVNKAPSAGLWPGQTDEEELGMTYKVIDNWLGLSELYEVKEEQGIWTNKDWLKIKDMIDKNRFKHELPKRLK